MQGMGWGGGVGWGGWGGGGGVGWGGGGGKRATQIHMTRTAHPQPYRSPTCSISGTRILNYASEPVIF
jgi:hypothetical protein